MAVEFSAPDTAQSPVGDIRKLVGDAWIDGVFGERLVEREGMVYQFDRIIVGEASSVVLRFTDGGVLILGPGAEAVISSYFLDVNGAAGGIDLTILEGAFYFAHGLIGSSVLGRVALETPLGVIEAEDSIFFGDLLTGNGAGFISIIEGFASLTRSGATVDLEEGVSAVFRDSTQEGLYSAFGDALIVPDDFQDRYAEFFAEVPFLQQRLVESLERAGQSLPDGATDNQGRDLVEERTAPQRSWWRNAETEDSLSEYDSTVVGGTILAAEARPTTFSSPGPSPFSFADSDLDPNESGPGTSVPDLQFTLTVADDIFLLSGGNDRITGTAVTLNPGDELVGGGGSDSLTLMGGGVFDLAGLNQFAEFETVALDDSGSSLMLRDGVDLAVVTGAGADAVTLGTGNDAVNLSGGNDTLMAVAATLNAGDDLRGGLGSDSLMLTGGGLFDLSGLAQVAGLEAVALDNSGSDLVLREGTDLIVTAGSGVDRITLGSGNDTVDLGGGDDSFNAASSSFNPGDDLDGGLGTDTLALTGGGAFDLSALAQVVGLEIVTLDDSGSSLTLRDGVDLTIAAGTAADSITLGSGDDIVDLGGDDDTLRAAAAALNPGDDLDGGAGTDTLILTTAGVYDISGLGQVVGLEAIRTTGDTDLTLGNATNTVAGGSAADTVNLGTGGDVIALAGGNDTIRADAATLGPGDDLDGGLGTDSLALTGGGAFDLSGLAQFAGFEVVTLDDIGSNLTLRDGTDVAVTAGTGADAVTLGSGNDTLDLGSGDDTIDAAAGTLNPGDDLVGGAGTDTLTLSSAGTYDLSALAQVSGLEAIRTTGSTDLTLNNATGVVVTLDNAANTVLGGAAADTVVLGSSSDNLNLAGGDDTISAVAATFNPGDALDGGLGTDSLALTGGGAFDLSGLAGFVNIEAVTLDDSGSGLTLRDGVDLTVTAGTGVDTVTLGTGGDTLDLGAGNDTIAAISTTLNATDSLDGGLGTDSLALTGGGAFDLSGLAGFVNIEAVTLDDSGSDLTLLDGVNLTVAAGTGVDTVTLGTGDDTLDLGAGNDTIAATSTTLNATDSLDGGLGTDSLALTGGGAFDLSGLAGFVNIEAVTLDDSGSDLTLRDGVDLTVTAGTGVDTVTLGTGDDTLDLGAGNDTVNATSTTLNAGDNLDGGLGTDSLALTGGGAFDLSGLAGFVNIEAVTLDDSGSDLTLRDGVDLTVTAGTGADTVTLGTGDDTLDLGAGNDTIAATSTTLNAGDDLDGGLGSDTLALTGAGTYDLSGLAQFAGFEAISTTGVTDLTLSNAAGITVTLDNAANTVLGGLAADSVALGSGTDSLDLAGGNDTIVATSTTLNAADDLDGALGTDTLALTGGGAFDLSGLAGFVNIEAVTLDDTGSDLTLLDGVNLTVAAGTGVDTVTLGTGDDTLDLGAGNDTIAATSTTLNATDDLDGGLGTDSLALTGGGAFDLSGLAGFVNIEAVMLDDSGSDLTLRDGVDLTVTAGTGADTVTLGTGDDTLDAGGGDDTVQAAAAAFNVADDLDGGLGTDTLVLTGGGTFNLPGLARFVNFEALVMDNSGASLTLRDGISLSVTAGLGADIVTLGNGNDTIEATAAALNAADELTGGAGTDLLHLLAAGTYDLSALAAFATFEAILTTGNTDLTLSAAAGIVVTLDNATNTVIGGTAADTVILGTGTDTLNLGDGVDVVRGTLATLNLTDDLDGGLGTDILELTGGGTLSLAGLVDFTGFEEIALDDNSWNLTLVGGQGIALTGGAGDDVVLGVAGDQTLNLGGGDDTLDLSLSLDAVTVDLGTAAAQLISATQGTDTLQGIENLRGSIFSDLLTGDANANTLTGLLGDDTLIGGGGADVLDGGLGIDAMTGGAGADQFVFDGPLDGTPVLLDVGIVLGLDLYDLLPDFQTGEDQLVLSEAGFGLGGALTDGVNFFTIGGAYTGINVGAAPGVPIIVVDGTNSVYYDPSGGALGLPGYVVLAEGLNTQPVIGDFAFAA